MTEKEQKIVEYINGMHADDKIALHNAYCAAYNNYDSMIYSMDELEEVLQDVDKWQLVNMIRFGDFDFMEDFWGFNGYGNLESYTARDLPVYASDIADYVLSREDALDNDELEKILKEEEDNE